jgi:large subunit ribosomal protein L1
MSEDQKKQDDQAAAEERDEILDLENEEGGPDVSNIPTPDAGGTGAAPVDRNEEDAEAAAEELTEVQSENESNPKATAKAGKRSAKAIREEEAEAERKLKALEKSEEAPKPRVVQKPNPMKQYGKNYRASAELIDKTKLYEVEEAVELAKKSSKVKFDPSVELHIGLGVDPRQADQMVRSTVVLPAGTGKNVRVAVICGSDKLDEAKKAGADITSDGDLIDKIEKGQLDFDVLIATPDQMSKLSKVARVLGPRGLMPNPKSGTVTPNVGQAVEQAKAGRVEFRIDKQAIVHMAVGKASFEQDKLESNVKAAIDAILKAKPSSTKGTYVKNISMATSMGPGIKLDVQKAIAAAHTKK